MRIFFGSKANVLLLENIFLMSRQCRSYFEGYTMSMNFKIQQIVFENLLSQSSHGNEASNDGVRLALRH